MKNKYAGVWWYMIGYYGDEWSLMVANGGK